MTKNLSKRQIAILDCIVKSVQERGFPPTVREIGDATGVHSSSTTWYQLQILEARGYIQRLEGKARGIRVNYTPEHPWNQNDSSPTASSPDSPSSPSTSTS